MKRRNFVASLAALAAASCARTDTRRARYDEKECPFCSKNSGTCSYCQGSRKCNFCNGTGVRKTSTTNIPDQNIKGVSYEEECPYCKGSSECRYCDGVGECWACQGTGQIQSWDFQKKARLSQGEQSKKDKRNK
ncbi:MAG: hypothetical protein ACOC4C_01155 [Fibrobacterota bacterium]